MKTHRHLGSVILLLICFSTQTFAYTERNLLQKSADQQTVKNSLLMDQKWVPYPAYSDRAGWDKFLGDYKQEFIKNGEKYLNYEWKVVKASDYLEYERSGNRTIMENPHGANNGAIATLLMAELAEGKGRFMDQLINGVYYSCEQTSWVLSAHLNAQLSKRSLPDYDDEVIDLGSGERGALLSWTYYFMHQQFDKVSPQISKRLRYELQKRILDPYMKTGRYWWMALDWKPGDLVNNWNPWCNFNVLQCYMLLENDRDKLAPAVWRTMVSVDKFINYVKSDGACEEGPSYWGHAAGKLYDYLQLLNDATAGKVSLLKEPMIRRMGEYIVRSYVGNNWVVNFADASARGGGQSAFIYRFGKATGSQLMMNYAAYIDKQREPGEVTSSLTSVGTDIFRYLQGILYQKELEKVEAKFETPAYTWYPETQFCYMTNKNGMFFAAKGGFNNESHNHNDVGTFSLYLNQTPILIDAGVGTYTRQTFSSERYNIWTMQSNYHNLPMINNVPQHYGEEFKATDVKFNPKSMTFSLDIAGAYPKEAKVNSWVRTFKLGNNSLSLTDAFRLKESDSPNQINFLSWGDINVSVPGQIDISVNGQKIRISYDKKTFLATKESVPLTDRRLSNVWGKEIYRISLNSKTTATTGSYLYTITPIYK